MRARPKHRRRIPSRTRIVASDLAIAGQRYSTGRIATLMLSPGTPLTCNATGAAPTMKRTLLRSPGQFLAPE